MPSNDSQIEIDTAALQRADTRIGAARLTAALRAAQAILQGAP
jgi:hypothetical protein